METNVLTEVCNTAMEIIIDTRLRERRSNGRTEQEATDDVIFHLSTFGEDIFLVGITVLRQRGLIAENMNVYLVAWESVVIGPADSGQGVTSVPSTQEMEVFPPGSRWVDHDPLMDFNGRQPTNSDDETDQPDMTWKIVRDFSYGPCRRRSNTEAIHSLPRQTE